MLLTFGNVSDTAARARNGRPPIVRFANKLGFDGFTSVPRATPACLLATAGRGIRTLDFQLGNGSGDSQIA